MYRDIVNVGADGYMGISFFSSPETGTPLNCLGEIFESKAKGLSDKKCLKNGQTALK